MAMQFHVSMTGLEPLIIDLNDDESVFLNIDIPPRKFSESEPLVKLHGLRWRDEKHYHLGWVERSLSVGETVLIELKESEQPSSPIPSVEEYVEPEKWCGFCNKKASDVEVLIVKDMGLNGICDACVEVCRDEIEKRRAAKTD